MELSDAAYARLLALRTGLRRFERWSAQQAEAAGLTPAQHQLLLAIRGHHDARGATIGDVADYLLLRHHSVVGLIDRAENAGLVYRRRDEDDRRVVRLCLSDEGAARIEKLSALHLEELERLALDIPAAWKDLDPVQHPHGRPNSGRETERAPMETVVARVYDELPPRGLRVLVDRLWPRGIKKADAPFERWAKELAPTTELRKWYDHVPERFPEFARRYRQELDTSAAREELESLRSEREGVVLVTATKDLEHSAAVVLQDVLRGR